VAPRPVRQLGRLLNGGDDVGDGWLKQRGRGGHWDRGSLDRNVWECLMM
jgi:hypothetical protein